MKQTQPTMNYPLKHELDSIGSWSCAEIRMGSYKCNCNRKECDHKTNPCEFCSSMCTREGYYRARPSTLYEKLDDAFRSLNNFWEALKVYDNPYPRAEDTTKKFSKDELRIGINILKFQCQAYRKILFPNEHRLIYTFCKVCNKKTFYYRLPYRAWFHSDEEFPIILDKLNNMFHCLNCHLVMYEHEIGKIEYREPSSYQKYLNSKEGLRAWLDEWDSYDRPIMIQKYYKDYEPKLKRLPMHKFFINQNNQYSCIGCFQTYKRKDLAIRHWRRFWNLDKDNKHWVYGCMRGIRNTLRKTSIE